MSLIGKKLKSRGGATMILALVFFLLCGVVATIIVTAAGVNTGRVVSQRGMLRAGSSVTSAAELLKDTIGGREYVTVTYTVAPGLCGLDGAPADTFQAPGGQFSDLLTALCAQTPPAACDLTFSGEGAAVKAHVAMDSGRNITVTLDTLDENEEKYPLTVRFAATVTDYATASYYSHEYDTGEVGDDGEAIIGLCEYSVGKNVNTVLWDGGTVTKGAER